MVRILARRLAAPTAVCRGLWFRLAGITNQLTPLSCVLLETLTTRSASQGIPRLLWNQKFHYCFHKSPPPVRNLNQMNPVHTLYLHFPKTRFNITLPSTLRSCEWSLPSRLSKQNFVPISHLCDVHYVPISSRFLSFYLLRLSIL